MDTPSLGEGADATEVTVTATVTGTIRFAEAQTVAVSIGGGTATSATDYEAVAAVQRHDPRDGDDRQRDVHAHRSAIDDDVDETNETIDVTGALAGVTVTEATISLTDDDTRGVTVTGSPLTIDEADDAQTDAKENEGSYTVRP